TPPVCGRSRECRTARRWSPVARYARRQRRPSPRGDPRGVGVRHGYLLPATLSTGPPCGVRLSVALPTPTRRRRPRLWGRAVLAVGVVAATPMRRGLGVRRVLPAAQPA